MCKVVIFACLALTSYRCVLSRRILSKAKLEAKLEAKEQAKVVSDSNNTKAKLFDKPCSSKSESSCKNSWREKTLGTGARCNWLEGQCLPNCVSPRAQTKYLCESPWCQWNDAKGTCGFNPEQAPKRRRYCDSVVGEITRRYTNPEGKQYDFYNPNNIQEKWGPARRSFCRDMFGDGDDPEAAHGKYPVDVISSEVAKCWRPNPQNRDSYSDPSVVAEMKKELDALMDTAQKGNKRMYPTIMETPIEGLSIAGYTPSHVTVGLTNTWNSTHGTSYCLNFDYNSPSGQLDDAGCIFFKRSFKPLQDLTRCILPAIREDHFRKQWQMAAIGQGGNYDMMGQWNWCKGRNACNKDINDFERVLEIVKLVELDSWEGLDAGAIQNLLRKRILSTLSVPPNSHPPALQQHNVDRIVQCFGAPASTSMVKETLRCMPLTWDYIQIPGVAAGHGLTPRVNDWGKDHMDAEYKDIHPLCGRLVTAGLTRTFLRVKYPQGVVGLARTFMTDNTCMTAQQSQCWCFGECFDSFLHNQAGKLTDKCWVRGALVKFITGGWQD